MKHLSWNVQGLGNPWTIRALVFLIRKHSPDTIFLMETHLNKCTANFLSINF